MSRFNGFSMAEVKGISPRSFGERPAIGGCKAEPYPFIASRSRERVRVRGKKAAFTLAEVLITLGVIGVVAAVTLPSFMTNITQRVNSERQANIAQKVTQAMEHMRAHGLLNTQYPTTEAFVDELQKYLKITKRCDSEHVAECWPTSTVTMSDGEELEVSKAKTGKNLSLSTDTNNVGLILADGASIILNYNPAKNPIDVGDRVEATHKSLPVGNGKEKEFIYTTDVTDGVDFVMDVNGGKKPNSEVEGKARDIKSFKSAQFSKGGPDCSKYANSFEVPDVGCVVNVGKDYEAVTDPNRSSFIRWYDKGCGYPMQPCSLYQRYDYWLGAMDKCLSLGDMHLASMDELNKIYANKDKVDEIPSNGYFWSSTEFDGDDIKAYYKGFHCDGCYYGDYYKYGNNNVMCVGN